MKVNKQTDLGAQSEFYESGGVPETGIPSFCSESVTCKSWWLRGGCANASGVAGGQRH
jgi:hypothetical protein